MSARRAVLGIDDGAFFHGSAKVFANVTFMLDDARTALVGENGIGKSTLLKCLAGELELNRGQVVRSRTSRVGWVPQEVPPELLRLSVREALARSLARVGMEDEDWRIDVLLDEIGADPEAGEQRFGTLSGGWQRLMLIAGVARLEAPDVLLLDEPTNHLDIAAIRLLEDWLTEDFGMPMLIVSHDRAFLNRVSDRTLFLRSDGTHLIKAPFAQAREELLRRDAAAGARHRLEALEIRRLEKVAARYHAWGVKNPAFHKRQKATETRIAHIEAARTLVHAANTRRLELADAEMETRAVVRIGNLAVSAPGAERPLFRIDRLAIAPGDKVALIGPNGVGKSTLLGAIAAAFAARGPHYDAASPIRFSPACRLAVFDQAMSALPLDESLLAWIIDADGVVERDAIRLLARAGFPFPRLKEPIAVLSQGERARLMFLKMKLQAPNLYLLDEPTSHLDIEGQEALEEQLDETDVACVFVSHDRFFTRSAATRFLEIRAGRLVEVDDAEAFFDGRS